MPLPVPPPTKIFKDARCHCPLPRGHVVLGRVGVVAVLRTPKLPWLDLCCWMQCSWPPRWIVLQRPVLLWRFNQARWRDAHAGGRPQECRGLLRWQVADVWRRFSRGAQRTLREPCLLLCLQHRWLQRWRSLLQGQLRYGWQARWLLQW